MRKIVTRAGWLTLLLTVAVVTPQARTSDAGSQAGLAAQPGAAYALILGPSSIDDGLSQPSDSGVAAAAGFSAASDLLGTTTAKPAVSSPAVAAARQLDAAIPESEYDLTALAKTLPDDPDALYRFVTDQIAVDGYDGVMRGPLVTWMSRAGGPTDKAALLAWLLVTKRIPYQFVRGTLAPAERARLAEAEATARPAPSAPAAVKSYTAGLAKDGQVFAAWARGVLSASKVPMDAGSSPADRVSPRHYWIQILRSGRVVDLDPTLPNLAVGTHLGTIDASFTPTAVLPKEEWHQLEIRVTASFANNTEKTLIDHTDTVANLAYAPIRLVFAPSGSGDPMQPGAATAFVAGLQIGSVNGGSADLDLGTGATSVRAISLEIRRKAPAGPVIEVARRSLIDAHTPAADRAYQLAGMTSIVVAPGRGAIAFATHMQFRTLQQWVQAAADAKAGKTPAVSSWYPIRILDYYERDDAMADALAASGGARLFRDRPNVAMLRTSFVRRAAATDVVTAFDIADNGMNSLAAARDLVIHENLVRGYADARIEHDVLEDRSGTGTIALFDAARAQQISPSAYTQAPPIAEELESGVDQTLAAGQVAIAPTTPVKVGDRTVYGWWAIDPASGNSVGRMTGGGGQDLAEESLILKHISALYTAYGVTQTSKTCSTAGFASPGCAAAVCATVASFIFGGGSLGLLAENYVA
ncbi:MAG: hypothetical protein ACRD1V_19005, partial [Vicinamibacterales bacterium]